MPGKSLALQCTWMTALWRLQVLAANQSPAQKKWFQGTADAVRQYLWLFENSMREGIEDFLILAGESAFIIYVGRGISRSLDMILSPLMQPHILAALLSGWELPPPALNYDTLLQGTIYTA